jgi:predicted metal-binding protein
MRRARQAAVTVTCSLACGCGCSASVCRVHCPPTARTRQKKEEQKVITGFRDAIDSCDHRLFSGSSRPTSSRVLGE